MVKVSLRAYNREIETMIDRGQLDEAIAHCHHILKTFPKHLETYRLLGKALLESKRYGDAADIFLRILASVPNDFVAQVGMSIIRDEENKLDDAIWHMERAFETQPSNPAIQSELQRLYARRDGVQPPRIRMTRGALAHMYVHGELYPQAISEIKSVLKDDAGRFDMQALLSIAYYKSGSKNDAADVASALLRRYPYSLDANRVLSDILGAERPENAQAYRQRVIELDPYASQITGTLFHSNEIPDAAVALERLDWNGQPVSMQADWGETKAISLENDASRNEQPDWLKDSFEEMTPPAPSRPTPASIFSTPAPSQPAAAQPAEDIPDFLRAAGWGQSTGAFDESSSSFTEESPTTGISSSIEQGDLPDWIKAMKPAEPEAAAAPTQEEDLPDWINNIGKGALSSQPEEQSDWMSHVEQPSSQPEDPMSWMTQPEQTPAPTPAPVDAEPDWINQFSQTPTTPVEEDTPDWLKSMDSGNQSAPSDAQSNEPDWLKGFGRESDFTPQPAQTDTPDWLKGFGSEPEAVPTQPTDELDWMQQLTTASEAPDSGLASTDFDFLDQLTEEPILQTAPESTSSPVNTDNLGVSDQERDDSFAWLEGLAAKQGASEGLLTKPEDRLEQEPEWVRQAKGLAQTPTQVEPPVVSPPAAVEAPISQSPINADELGVSEQERDDSFAWLEGLAAKQGASEGLLTKPEDRLEQEPEWVRQAKGLSSASQPAAVEPPVSQPPANMEELGKSVQEQDDSFAWLENLAAKQGATEGLLTKPEERLEQEPEWVRQAKDMGAQQPSETPPAVNRGDLGKSEQEQDDSFAWLENLAAKQGATEGLLTKPEERLEQEPEWVRQAKDVGAQQPPVPIAQEPAQPVEMDDTATWLESLDREEKQSEPVTPAMDETAMWLRNLDKEESDVAQPAEADEMAMPAWMKNLDDEESPATGITFPAQETQEKSEWKPLTEEPVAFDKSKVEEDGIPNWLADLDNEESKPALPSADDDLPAWLRTDEASPVTPEPTRPTDWKPVEDEKPEVIYTPSFEEIKPPEIIFSPPLEEKEEPVSPVSMEEPQAEVFKLIEESTTETVREEPKPEPRPFKKASVKPAPAQDVPTTRRGTGMLVMPGVDPMLGLARNELSRSNIPGALETYGKLIKKGRYLDEVVYDLREALYRYPVEVSIWQSLGDAYMRSNRLQDALDAYTKAEELLR